MVHMSDIAWGVSGEDALNLHHKGETVQAVVLDVDVEKERISLGIKQLERGGPSAAGAAAGARKNEVVTVPVLEIRDGGLAVQNGEEGATGFLNTAPPPPDPHDEQPARSHGEPQSGRE